MALPPEGSPWYFGAVGQKKENSLLLWGLVGCAGFCLVGVCGLSGAAVYLLVQQNRGGTVAEAEWEPKPQPVSDGPVNPPSAKCM